MRYEIRNNEFWLCIFTHEMGWRRSFYPNLPCGRLYAGPVLCLRSAFCIFNESSFKLYAIEISTKGLSTTPHLKLFNKVFVELQIRHRKRQLNRLVNKLTHYCRSFRQSGLGYVLKTLFQTFVFCFLLFIILLFSLNFIIYFLKYFKKN